MRRIRRLLPLLLGLLLALSACGAGGKPAETGAPLTWQEQYELGVRYLSEGKYEEAILAFTAAIDVDPRRVESYVGRAGAYVSAGETGENLTAAQADYETALELDGTLPEAYLGLADVYIRRGEYDKAGEILRQGYEKTGDQTIADKLAELEAGTVTDLSGKTRKSSHFEDGVLIEYWLYEYDEAGNNVKTDCYQADGTLYSSETSEFDQKGLEIRSVSQHADGDYVDESVYEYDGTGRRIRETRTSRSAGETTILYTLISYDEAERTETHDEYDEEDVLTHRFVIEYDENGVRTRASDYNTDESGELYLDYYVEYLWNEDGTYGGYELFQVAPREWDEEDLS